MVSISLRVTASWPSRIAIWAEARSRCDRLPIMPPVRWCRYLALRCSVPGSWLCSRSASSSVAIMACHSVAVREGAGADHDVPAEDLGAADPGQLAGDVDPGIDEGGGKVLGEVLQVVGHVLARGRCEIQVVDLIDQDELDLGLDQDLADSVGDIAGVVDPLDRGQPEEPGELGGELAG